MKELVTEYLNNTYYLSIVDNYVYLILDDSRVSFSKIEHIIGRVFVLDDDLAYAIVFNWLLCGGIKRIKENWLTQYGEVILGGDRYEMTVTDNVDFHYELIVDE